VRQRDGSSVSLNVIIGMNHCHPARSHRIHQLLTRADETGNRFFCLPVLVVRVRQKNRPPVSEIGVVRVRQKNRPPVSEIGGFRCGFRGDNSVVG